MPISSVPARSQSQAPREYAVIDLGSNSFQMLVARIANDTVYAVDRIRYPVRLAAGLNDQMAMSEESMQRGLDCLALFAERLQGFPAESVSIIGTYTLRVATNTDVFLERAAAILPYPIEVVSGHQEARLIFMGVEHTQPEQGQILVIDIGGGSTECIIGKDFTPLLIESCSMGCVSFADVYFGNEEISPERFERARAAAAQKMVSSAAQFSEYGWECGLGTSSTIKSISRVLASMEEPEGRVTRKGLERLVAEVLKYTTFDSLILPGLPKERKGIFVPGLAILCGVFDALGLETLHYCASGLREGMLYETEPTWRCHDIRSRSFGALTIQYMLDVAQAERVTETMLALYAQWRQQNPTLVNAWLEPLVHWSGMLHEMGLSLNYSWRQRHAAYILQNASIPGFDQEQLSVLSAWVGAQRKGIKVEDIPFSALFRKEQLLPLILILRLAVILHRKRQASALPDAWAIESKGMHWTLYLPERYQQQQHIVMDDLEKEKSHWKKLGWKLSIRHKTP
ncbi:Ppx/GppA phosphatase family protein [Zymobacter palmae]|uniref:Exopolyphosphatase n=1 Tax=Zymobacter palmae TaxID=33074 RepID=A0A348HFC0_9GAMM|nr:exopolyphosphatase [Zymobacter palmae]BBG30322.1 exopolyphosphatase [Zymobacter palmae]